MLNLAEKENLLKTWKECLNAHDLKESATIEHRVFNDGDILYNEREKEAIAVLAARTALGNKDFAHSKKSLIRLEKYLPYGNEETLYYYHYLNGILLSQHKKYEQAILSFKMAKKHLDSSKNPFERADYHYRLALTYYEIDKITLSIQHVNTAFEINYKAKNYKRMADCQCLLGSNHNELRLYSEAEMHYNKALMYGQKVDYKEMETIIYHNLGFFYSGQKKSLQAIKNLELALKGPGLNSSFDKMKTFYLLARENYRTQELEAGNEWYAAGMELAIALDNTEYTYHLRALKTNYDPDQRSCNEFENEYLEIVNYFEENGLWDYVYEYSNFLATYYKDQEQFEEACEYYDLASLAKEKMEYKGVLI